MKFHKRFAFIGILLIIFFVAISFKSTEKQVKARKALTYKDIKPDWYWFSIKVRIDNRMNIFKFVGVSGGIIHGKQLAFEKALWKGLSRKQFIIGPFEQRKEAENAKRLYVTDSKKIKPSNDPDRPQQINWFAITFEESPRMRIYILRRAPGAVNTGSEKMFVDAFFQQLQFKMLEIGPFYNYEQAELAKRLYRKNE